jgi:hypothetical protein
MLKNIILKSGPETFVGDNEVVFSSKVVKGKGYTIPQEKGEGTLAIRFGTIAKLLGKMESRMSEENKETKNFTTTTATTQDKEISESAIFSARQKLKRKETASRKETPISKKPKKQSQVTSTVLPSFSGASTTNAIMIEGDEEKTDGFTTTTTTTTTTTEDQEVSQSTIFPVPPAAASSFGIESPSPQEILKKTGLGIFSISALKAERERLAQELEEQQQARKIIEQIRELQEQIKKEKSENLQLAGGNNWIAPGSPRKLG